MNELLYLPPLLSFGAWAFFTFDDWRNNKSFNWKPHLDRVTQNDIENFFLYNPLEPEPKAVTNNILEILELAIAQAVLDIIKLKFGHVVKIEHSHITFCMTVSECNVRFTMFQKHLGDVDITRVYVNGQQVHEYTTQLQHIHGDSCEIFCRAYEERNLLKVR